ncbi:MAG: blue light receptor [Alyxoria varia]|nr:MAG: blue light receptor [Alyxoria varia]
MEDYFGNSFMGAPDFGGSMQGDGGGDPMSGLENANAEAAHLFGGQTPNPGTARSNVHQSIEENNQRASDNGGANNGGQQNMVHFGGMSNGGGMNNFQFAPSGGMGQSMQMPTAAIFPTSNGDNMSSPQGNAQFNFVAPVIGNTSPYGVAFPQMQGFSPGMLQNGQANMGMVLPQQNNHMNGGDSSGDANTNNMMKNGMVPFNLMTQGQTMQPVMMAPVYQNFQRPQQQGNGGDMSGNTSPAAQHESPMHETQSPSVSMPPSDMMRQSQSQSRNDNISRSRQNSMPTQSPLPHHMHHHQMSHANQQSMSFSPNLSRQDSGQATPQATSNPYGTDGQEQQRQQQQQQEQDEANMSSFIKPSQETYKSAYSSTGFDMLTVLMKVATRPNPEINIGSVDMSCAFVVCDAQQHDIPIIYCSENFERLTGYTKHEIIGRNCRFLQAPKGHVQAGVKRAYVDDDTVVSLRNRVTSRREAQVSLINYRKGGQPFMNLLTIIPVSYEANGQERKFYVGFQVDLVEKPHAVTNKNNDGSYAVNYQRGLTMPRYVFTGADKPGATVESGQTISRDEVSTVLSTIGSGESELSKRIWDKMLLENTDDVVFVLSLKGLFLYLSPSSKRILEYDSTELMGTALSSVCHPSDIVPVTRELKDTTSGAPVSAVFRIRRKNSGYTWFEGHGALHTEQGKGRKSIVLVGRERPVYTINQAEITKAGGIADNEVWTKLSTSGMFLFVSSSIRSLLDKQPEELVGTSMQSLMRPDSRSEFMRKLEYARSGRRAQCRHELLNRRGQVLQAFSTIYPGDAPEDTKPTFFVAQTRLLKYTRPTASSGTTNQKQNGQGQVKTEGNTNGGTSQPASPSSPLGRGESFDNSRPTPNYPPSSGAQATSPTHYVSTFEAATTYAGQDSLPLGSQDAALADDLNLFDELKTTRSTSWQFELRQMEKRNRLLAEELQALLAARKKRKRRKGAGALEKDCANCHTRTTPEWRRGPSGNRDLCNSCGLRWAKQQGRISPRTNSHRSGASAKSDKTVESPRDLSHGQAALQQQQQPKNITPPAATTAAQSSGTVAATVAADSATSSHGESRSIDEALAEAPPTVMMGSAGGGNGGGGGGGSGGGKQQTSNTPPTTGAAGVANTHVSKMAKVEEETMSPPKRNSFSWGVPTKIEEGDESVGANG